MMLSGGTQLRRQKPLPFGALWRFLMKKLTYGLTEKNSNVHPLLDITPWFALILGID